MSNMDVRVCKCGRIHLIPWDKINKAIEADKELVVICSGCGAATVIGADKGPNIYDESSDYCYELYSCNWSFNKDTVINKDSFDPQNGKAIDKILYTSGIRVPMMTGMYATDFAGGVGFSDRWYPDFYELDTPDLTIEKVRDFIAIYQKNRTTVNMSRLIHENDETVLKEISSRGIEGLNWIGTPYAHCQFNSEESTGYFSSHK